jgi:hypothetical protein
VGRHIEIVDGWILGKTREKDREIQGRARQREGLALKTNSQVVVRARI